ncbi:MAG TPA: ATP-dependent Clp protease adaptor ClpS [Puia sp.]
MPDLLHNPRPVEICAIRLIQNLAQWRITAYDGPSAGASPKQYQETDVITAYDDPFSLIVWNDEVNTFEWVIETLMEVCGHSQEQAEQCAMIIHTKGKYAVKRGSYDDLKPLCDAITDRGIGATIEILSES